MEKDHEITRTSLRIPRGLYDRIEASARERGLTMHADMISRLEDSFTSGEEIEYLREKDRENERVINRLTATAQAKVKTPPPAEHDEPQEMPAEFYQQMERIIERTIRRVRDEERKAGLPPLENDVVHEPSGDDAPTNESPKPSGGSGGTIRRDPITREYITLHAPIKPDYLD